MELYDRRTFLAVSAAGMAAGQSTAQRAPDAGLAAPQTFTYGTVGDCPITADVYGAARGATRSTAVRPRLV